jgi:anti-anti-sigma regulatory factor
MQRRQLAMHEPHRITLGGDLGLRETNAIREQLLDAFDMHTAVELDIRDLAGIDISIVQLLIAADKMAEARGHSFQVLAEANGPLRDAMARGGLLAIAAGTPFDVHWQTKDAAS